MRVALLKSMRRCDVIVRRIPLLLILLASFVPSVARADTESALINVWIHDAIQGENRQTAVILMELFEEIVADKIECSRLVDAEVVRRQREHQEPGQANHCCHVWKIYEIRGFLCLYHRVF